MYLIRLTVDYKIPNCELLNTVYTHT